MGEKPMAPNSRIPSGNQSQTVAAPSVEHGAEARKNQPTMTDEERARELLFHWGAVVAGDAAIADFLEAFAAIRAHEREECAKVAESEACEEPPKEELDIGYDMACADIASAIRERGKE